MSETPDDGFYHQKPAQTASEAVVESPRGRDIGVTKAVLMRYIQKWLSPDGFHRRLLERYSPRSANFVLNRQAARAVHVETGFSWETDDATERKVQVSRFHSQLKERYPAVLIVDGGFRNRPAGLGDIQGARFVGGTVVDYDIVTSLVVSVEIIVAALDESTCSDLAMLISTILGSPLRRFGGGNQLTDSDQGTSYQITLPLENSFSSLSRENITEDAVDSKWSCTCSLEIGYESTGSLRSAMPIRGGDDDLDDIGGSQPYGEYASYVASVSADLALAGPTSVRMGRSYSFQVQGPGGRAAVLPDGYKIQVTDRRLASLRRLGSSTIVLKAKKPGSIEIRLVNPALTETDADTGHTAPKVVTRLAVTITVR